MGLLREHGQELGHGGGGACEALGSDEALELVVVRLHEMAKRFIDVEVLFEGDVAAGHDEIEFEDHSKVMKVRRARCLPSLSRIFLH